MKYTTFILMPWKYTVYVLVGGEPLDVAGFVEKELGIETLPGALETSLGHCWFLPGAPVVIWVRTLKDIPCLLHEVMHATFAIMFHRGLKLSWKSDEAYTYTAEDLMRRILLNKKWSRP